MLSKLNSVAKSSLSSYSPQLSLFKRLSSTKAKQVSERDAASKEGLVGGEQPAEGTSRALESKDSGTNGGQQQAQTPATKSAHSATCTIL